MESWATGVIGLVVGLILALVGRKLTKGSPESSSGQEVAVKATKVARETINKTLIKNAEELRESLKGDDPAGELASKGNARRRK